MSGLEVVTVIVLFLWASGLSATLFWIAKRHHELVAITMVNWQVSNEILAVIANRLNELKTERKNVH